MANVKLILILYYVNTILPHDLIDVISRKEGETEAVLRFNSLASVIILILGGDLVPLDFFIKVIFAHKVKTSLNLIFILFVPIYFKSHLKCYSEISFRHYLLT